MSLGSVLSIARQAMSVQQNIIQTAGHNISNVETPGFSRQRVDTSAMFPQVFSFGAVGTGVQVDNVRRMRDELLDVTWRKETGGASAAGLRKELLSSIEQVLGEPSDTGLSAAMDAMWSSWSDLASTPTSAAARAVVVQRAQAVASQLNGFDQRLEDIRNQSALRLTDSVSQINALADQIAQVNTQVVSAEVSGNQAPDLRDQRDRLIDQLSALGDVRVFIDARGSAQVLLGSTVVVDGSRAQQLRIAAPLDETDITTGLALVSDPARKLLPIGGKVGEMVNVLNGSLRDTQDRLDALATTLARAVNAVHAVGVDATGQAGVPIFVDRGNDAFDPTGDPFLLPRPNPGTVTARTIGVNTAILANNQRLAASSGADRPADNDVALAMAALRSNASVTVANANPPVAPIVVRHLLRGQAVASPTTGITLGEHYRAAASALGTQVRDAISDTTVRETLVRQVDARRASASGVNMDEELTNLMRAQQAYAAAAKVVSAADEMMQVLTQMI